MSQLLDRFIDLNVRFEKMSRKDKEEKHKRLIDLIVKETVSKLGDATDYVIDAFVTSISCVISYNQKYTQEHYDRLKKITPFAVLPPFKEYKKTTNIMQANTQKIIRDFLMTINKYKSLVDDKYVPYCVEFLATLNGEIEYLIMYTKMFKG